MTPSDETVTFVPGGFQPPTALDHPSFRLRPLTGAHNERDHVAWMGSVDHIRSTPGYPDGDWPSAMSLDDNLEDLEQHHADFLANRGFTFTVLSQTGSQDDADVIGCVYIYPDKQRGTDVEVQSWVTADHADLDVVLAETVRAWLAEAWPWQPEQIRDHPRDGTA